MERPDVLISADAPANYYVLVTPDAPVRYVPVGYASLGDLDFHVLAADANSAPHLRYR